MFPSRTPAPRPGPVLSWLAGLSVVSALTAAPSPTAPRTSPEASPDHKPPVAAAVTTEPQEERYSLAGGKRLELQFTTTAVIPARLYVRINHGPFRVVQGGVVRLFEDGLFQIAWYAEDATGKKSAVEERVIRLDSTPPQISYTVRAASTGKAEVRLVAIDMGVGGARLEWRRRAEDTWAPYTEPLSFPADAPISLEARASDALGNTTPAQAIQVALNRTPKAVSALFREPFARADGDGRIYVVRREVPIPLEMQKGNLELIEDGQPARRLGPGSSLQFPDDGKRRLIFRVGDEHGNTIDTAVDVIVDTRPPRSRPVQLDPGRKGQ